MKNRVYVYFVSAIIFLFYLSADSQFTCSYEESWQDLYWRYNIRPSIISNNLAIRSGGKIRVVRLNFRYMLSSAGRGNFTETGSMADRFMSGYQFAKDIVDEMNRRASYNIKMNLPPGNNTPVLDKNYRFVIEGVYFHRDDNYTKFNKVNDFNYRRFLNSDYDEVFDVFMTNDINGPGGGNASSIGHPSKIKFTRINRSYDAYMNFVNSRPGTNHYDWVLHAASNVILHEAGHLFGLSHTVRFRWGAPCLTNLCNGRVDMDCGDDDCDDTPTAEEMTRLWGAPFHPACGWGYGGLETGRCNSKAFSKSIRNKWCGNNQMDYSGYGALTPKQLNIIWDGLDNDMKTYRVCRELKGRIWRSIFSFRYPVTAYYGQTVRVYSGTTLDRNGIATIYFSNDATLHKGVEIKNRASFEMIPHYVCD